MNRLIHELVARMPSQLVFPAGLVEPIEPKVRGRSFFPGGCGLFDGSEQPIPERPVLLVGQDFGTQDYWNGLGTDRESEDGTWSGLKKLLASADIDPRRCFFTNALLGVRVAQSMEGPSPGLASTEYVDACMEYFHEQLEVIRPLVIVTLGVVPTMLVARALGIAPNLIRPMPKQMLQWDEIDAVVEPFVRGVTVACAPSFAFASSVHPVRYWLNAKLRSWTSRSLSGVAAHDAVWSEVRSMLAEVAPK